MRRLFTHAVAFLVGALLIPVGAQINTNDAVYGRMFGTGIGTWLATPTSANLATALTDETGSGKAVFDTSPVLATPNLGVPSALALDNATDPSPVAVGSLPTCNAGNNLKTRIVTDSLTPSIGIAVSAGGALRAMVLCVSGTGWIVL